MMPNPMPHSDGVLQMDTMIRKRHAKTKESGNRMFTCEQKKFYSEHDVDFLKLGYMHALQNKQFFFLS